VIFDDDAAPPISIADVAVEEGQMAALGVTLSAVSEEIDAPPRQAAAAPAIPTS